MSRVRSDGELKEITWLTAKVREEKEERRFVVFAIDKKAGRRELKKPENQKKKNLKLQVDLLERQIAALIAASPSSARTAVADAMSRIPSSVALSSSAYGAGGEEEEGANDKTAAAAAAAAAGR